MNFLRTLLFPFAIIYGIVVWLRNRFYDIGWFKSTSFSIPVIVVGNLEVGGSGKTPLTEYLVKLFSSSQPAVLSRGYGRKSKGFRWVKENDNPEFSGDEPLQIKNKFPAVAVAVCENRIEGIHEIEAAKHQLVILDDAYQHRAVKPGYSILVFDYHKLKNLRLLLPAGNYRDFFSERQRADMIVVSKSPENLSLQERQVIQEKMALFAHQKMVFTSIKYSHQIAHVFQKGISISPETIDSETAVLLITGIAKPAPLLKEIKKYTSLVKHHDYPDHHLFTTKNMLKLVKDFEALDAARKVIITTEKDAVRLANDENKKYISELPVYKWTIEIAFNREDEELFNEAIINYVERNKRIS